MKVKTYKLSLGLAQRWQQRRLGSALLLIGSIISSLYWIVLFQLATTASNNAEVTTVEIKKRNYEPLAARKYSPSEVTDSSLPAQMKPETTKEMSSVDYMACCGAGTSKSQTFDIIHIFHLIKSFMAACRSPYIQVCRCQLPRQSFGL